MSDRGFALVTWLANLLVVLGLAVMPVFAGHGGALFGQVMVMGWRHWLPAVVPAWVGTVALVGAFPFLGAPRSHWLALAGLVCLAAAVLVTIAVLRATLLLPLLAAYGALWLAVVSLNVGGIVR